MHRKKDLIDFSYVFDWIGFPTNQKLRDFDIHWFLAHTTRKKRWWLGVHEFPIKNPHLILNFHGLDSTLPELYAGKYGKVWTGWRTSYTPVNRMHWRVIFEMNVQNFQLFLTTLERNSQKKLSEFLNA